MNYQANTSGDGQSAKSSHNVENVWASVYTDYLRLRPGVAGAALHGFDFEYTTRRNNRPRPDVGPDAEAYASRAAAHYGDLVKAAEAEAQRQREAAEARHAADTRAAGALRDRATYAAATLPPLWSLGARLSGIAVDIAATRPLPPSIENSHQASAPIGTDAELSDYLARLAVQLAGASDAVATIRAGIKARASKVTK